LDGTSQTVSGNNSFYNLTKSVSAADTLTFAAASTQTIASGGLLTLGGASGQLLSLRSGTTGTQWGVAVQGSTAVNYVVVKDSDASGGNTITAKASFHPAIISTGAFPAEV
jgi:hypothetical protein